MKNKCSHKAIHKEVLGTVLCVCCSHCQKENWELQRMVAELLGALKAWNGLMAMEKVTDLISKAERVLGEK